MFIQGGTFIPDSRVKRPLKNFLATFSHLDGMNVLSKKRECLFKL